MTSRSCRRDALRRGTAGATAGLVLLAALGLFPAPAAGVARAVPARPVIGSWIADGPTRTIVDAVTPLGATTTALLSQSADGVRRSADGGLTWSEPAGLPPSDAAAGAWSTSLTVLASDRRRAWLVVSSTPSPGSLAAGAGTRNGGDEPSAAPEGDAGPGPDLYLTADAGATWALVRGDGLAGRVVFEIAAVPSASDDPVLLVADAADGILRSTDGGITFTPATDGIVVDPEMGGLVVSGLAAGSASGVAFASVAGVVWRSTDAGLSWSTACVPSEALPCGRPYVAPGDPSLVLAAGFGGVARSADGGRTWSRAGAAVLPGPDGGGIDSIAFSADASPLAWASGPEGVYRSTDGGTAWEPWEGGLGGEDAAASDRLAIDPASRTRGWRIHGLSFFTTLDGGRSWTELPGPDPTGVAAYAALGDGEETRLVGTGDGIALRTESRWATTRADVIATDLAWLASAGPRASGAPGAAPGASGGPGGEPRSDGATTPPGPPADETTIAVFAATYGAGVLRSADGGATWEDWSRGLPRAPAWRLVVAAALGDRVLLATDAGAFERATDARAWAPLGFGLPDAAVRTLALLPDGTILAGLETRGLWRLARGLDEWRPLALDGRTILSVATASSDGRTLLAASERSGLWRSTDAGRTWRRVAATRTTASVAYDPVTRSAVLATGAAVAVSTDSGRTWRSATAGLPAPDPGRPWSRSTTAAAARPGGGFTLATLGGTYVMRPGGVP